MQYTHLVWDLETLGIKEADTVILSMAVVPFKFGSNESYDDMLAKGFYRKIDAKQQLKAGRSKNQDTIEWWKKQVPEAQANAFLPSATDIPIEQAFRECAHWIKTQTDYDWRNSWNWSRGTYFDFPKIEYNFDVHGIKTPFNTWMIRDIRTMIDCFTGSSNGQYIMTNEPANFVKHHCLHDAAHDAAIMQEIFNSLS